MGVADENTTFPTVLACPICKKTALHCYDDTAREDIWLTCDSCSAHGNIITFAAQIWKIDLAQALDKLNQAGLCASYNRSAYTSNIIRAHSRENAIAQFWKTAQKQLWTHDNANIAGKLRDFGVSKDIDCSALVGVAHAQQILMLCKTVARGFPAQFAREDCIVLPYHDLPGRLSGFLLYQYNEDLNLNKAFIGITRNARYIPDAGYYLIQAAHLPANSVFNNSLFVLDDPLWVLRAQAAQLWHGSAFLPLCASYAGTEARSRGTTLDAFPHTQRFFVSRALSPPLLTQAAATRGYVSIPPERVNTLPTAPRQTFKLLADMRRAAVTWQTALDTVFKTNTTMAAQAFTADLQIPRDKIIKFLQTRTTLSQVEITNVLERMRPNAIISNERKHRSDIVERDDCWHTTTGIVVTNCAPIITKVIYGDNNTKYYEGHVRKDGNTYDFFADAIELDKTGLLEFVARLLATHGEFVRIAEERWNAKSLQIALSLHQAQAVLLATEPGWNAKIREFCFRDYSLQNDGTFVPAPYPELCENNPLALPEPTAIASNTLMQLLTPAHDNATLWAIMAVALADMLAPVFDSNAAGFAISTNLFKKAQTFLPQIGCRDFALGVGKFANTARIAKIVKNLEWPTTLTNIGISDAGLESCILSGLHSPAILEVLPQSLATTASFGWHVIAPHAELPTEYDSSSLQFVVPAYIQHILRNRLTLRANEPLARTVLRDLHTWLLSVYGQSFNLDAAVALLLGPESAHLLLMHDINAAINDGELSLMPQPKNANQRGDFLLRNKQHWWINKKAVTRYFHRKTSIAPNWAALLNCFVQQGVFSGEKAINDLPGFLLDKSWCDDLRAGQPSFVAKKNVG